MSRINELILNSLSIGVMSSIITYILGVTLSLNTASILLYFILVLMLVYINSYLVAKLNNQLTFALFMAGYVIMMFILYTLTYMNLIIYAGMTFNIIISMIIIAYKDIKSTITNEE